MPSCKMIFVTSAPVAAAIISGIKAVILMSNKRTSKAKSTPAIGALNAAPIPPATPHARRSVLSLMDKRYILEKF